MKLHKILMTVGMASLLVTGCSNGNGELVWPDFPLTPGDKDSWEYFKDENGNVEEWNMEWYVNDTAPLWNSYGSDRVSEVLHEKTGVNIKTEDYFFNEEQKIIFLCGLDKPSTLCV